MILSEKRAVFNRRTGRKKAPYTKGQQCPGCGSAMRVRDSKKRGDKYQVRRYKCKRCDKMHTELPADLPPHMRKETDCIQDAVDGVPCKEEVENSTIDRWRKKYIPRLEGMLSDAGLEVPPREPGKCWLAEILSKIYSGAQKHTRFAFSPEAGAG
jgi:predicted RNA-binding Zn-ribbon protein involved in translation (DUF1610 family)